MILSFENLPVDVVNIIFKFAISKGSTFKNACVICTSFYKIAIQVFPNAKRNFCNTLVYLLEKYPDKTQGRWHPISSNINIPLEYIEKSINNPKCDWKWDGLSRNHIITLDFIEKYINNSNWDWSGLSRNPNLTLEFINKHIDKAWDWKELSCNHALVKKYIDKYPNGLPINSNLILRWNWHKIALNPYTSLELIDSIITSDFWDWDGIASNNANLTIPFIEKYIDKWNWFQLSRNVNLSFDVVEKYINRWGRWAWFGLSANKNLPLEFIENHINESWNLYTLSKNPAITIDFIQKHPEIPIIQEAFSCNPSLTLQTIENYFSSIEPKPKSFGRITLNWDGLSNNPNLTIDFIEKYSDKLNFVQLFKNKILNTPY